MVNAYRGGSQITFSVPDSAMCPETCPTCGYSIKELPEPRCPECGDRVDEGEVVLTGEPAAASRYPQSTRSRVVEAAVIAGAVGWPFVFNGEMPWIGRLIALIGVLVIFAGIVWWGNFRRRRNSYSVRAVRMTADGFEATVDRRAPKQHAWSRPVRWQLVRHRNGTPVRAFKYLGPFAVATLFYFFSALSLEQVEGCRERIEAWGNGRTTCDVIMPAVTSPGAGLPGFPVS